MKSMKKWLGLVLVLTLTAALFVGNMVSASADTVEAGKYTAEYDQEIDLLPAGDDASVWEVNGQATITGSHDEGWTLKDTNSWGANLTETQEWTYDDGWMLYYDIDVKNGLCGVWLKWWSGNVTEAIALDNGEEPGGEDANMLQSGRYTGILDLKDIDLGAIEGEDGTTLDEQFLLNVYIVQGRSTVRTLKLLHVTDLKGGEPETTTTEEPTTTAADATTTTAADANTTAAADTTGATEDGLSTGAIVGIVAAAVVVVGGVIAAVVGLKKKKA